MIASLQVALLPRLQYSSGLNELFTQLPTNEEMQLLRIYEESIVDLHTGRSSE